MEGDFERGGKSIVFWGISRSLGTMIWPDGLRRGHSLVLTSIGSREYPFLVKGGADSELNGREIRATQKANPYTPKSQIPIPMSSFFSLSIHH
jgi:hypothetical protein